ncbi:MIF4G like-domain-containing protein [Massariosphaeria phaeospora]|uniref:MIF4G like-domain-containing protein n=1 Tax=Massariosphaeria phaeospora TaxID=100035 RepID=A0A7C8M2Q2_9PLEO|nr:MIF4G like-domain-containing protein [Massariosphaeria phaeospora]
MADVDLKPDGRDDRRGRGGRNNRKRRRDDEDDQADRRGSQRRRRADDEAPRRTYEEPPFAKLRRLLLNIASSTKLPQDEAIEIAKCFADNYDDEDLRNDFFDIFVQLIIEQPFKIPFVAAVAFYANDVKPDITVQALTRVADRTQKALDEGQWKEFKLLLRFFACLQGLFQEDGIFGLLGQLFDTVVDMQSASEQYDVVGIELIKIILLTLPYAIVSSGTRFHPQAQTLLESTGVVASKMVPMEGLIQVYDSESEEKPIAYHSIIGLLQTQLAKESESGWALLCIPRFDPNALRIVKEEEEESLPTVGPTHALPSFTISSPVNPGPTPLFPEAYFSLFAEQGIETVPKLTDIAASLIRDAIVDTVDQLDCNRDVVAKYLVDLDCYWSLDTFAKRGTQFDKFRDATGDKVLWKSEDMIVDAIFSQLFKLPAPEHKLVYYHALIMQCCKVAPAAIAPSLGRAIRILYNSLHAMDLELGYRFLDWFSHHLSNFEFRWRWNEWVEDLPLSNLTPKKAMIIAALDKEIRLSFAKRIRSTIPEEMHYLIPERLDEDNSPDFKYSNADTPFSEEGQILHAKIRKRATAEEVQETIDVIHKKAEQAGITDVFVPSTDALVTAICRIGVKSLSHVLSCIERNKERLLAIAGASEVARRQIVASVVDYWKDHPGVAVRIINILLNYTVLAPLTVVQWVFGDHMGAGEALTESWVYEMVSNTVGKVTTRIRQIASVRLQKGLPQEQVDLVEATLTKERDSARELFKYIEDAVRGFAEGSADSLLEKESSGELSTEDGQMIRAWGKRWHAVVLRQAQVEESVVGEQAVEARLRLLASQPDGGPEPMEVQNGNWKLEQNDGDDAML